MTGWAKDASWDELIRIVWFQRGHDLTDAQERRRDEAIDEIYCRIPRVTDFSRVITERVAVKAPLGSLPDWEPSGIHAPKEDTWLVRLLSNDGYYPSEPIIHDAGILAADEEIAWSAVFWPGEHPSNDAPISWLKMEEVYFFGAVALAEAHPRTNGRTWAYTRSYPRYLHLPPDASLEDICDGSREIAMSVRLEEEVLPVLDRQPRPHLFDRDYGDSVEALLEAMEQQHSAVLLRGLYKFLIAQEMRRHSNFLEEMALAAIISREAALELLRRKLSASGGMRLNKEDVLRRIRTDFPAGEPFVEVLEMDWENRVIMVHPVSDYGEWWSPPMEFEECTDTLTTLIHLYRYLLLNEIWVPAAYD